MHQPLCLVCRAAIYTSFSARGCSECLGVKPRTWWEWLRGREHPEVTRKRMRLQAKLSQSHAMRNPQGQDAHILIMDEVDNPPPLR